MKIRLFINPHGGEIIHFPHGKITPFVPLRKVAEGMQMNINAAVPLDSDTITISAVRRIPCPVSKTAIFQEMSF